MDLDVIISDVDSAFTCELQCLKYEGCKGISIDSFNLCYLHHYLSPMKQCGDLSECFSKAITRFRSGYSCKYEPEDIIDEVTTTDAEECYTYCGDRDDCLHFIWFDQFSEKSNQCYLLAPTVGSEDLTVCNHCQSGDLYCLSLLEGGF